ncbi:sodium-dependent bicarbonate transport family permease [Elioraea thermophila]|uniref:sodium-dependent bicarbonate transport family permease n=1 Tax=Elioraea thermophila TaxID=2185104 RepID=UPI000DF1A8A2|nr:sodium-dependent bicarbonate transport family permease [Elioraea thermophila]
MLEAAARNLLDPAILFFVLGVVAGLIRSNLELPQPVTKFLSLYLLVAIGLKGGTTLAVEGLSTSGALAVLAALIMAILVPILTFLMLRRLVDPFNAVAVAGTYGSVSAVTFIAAQQFLTKNGIPFGGHMAVAMVLMETPAIILAVMLASVLRAKTAPAAQSLSAAVVQDEVIPALSLRRTIYEAVAYGGHVLLVGSLIIGVLAGAQAQEQLKPLFADLFKGILAFFLLDMGLVVGRQFGEKEFRLEHVLTAFALIAPMVYGSLALLLARAFSLAQGDAVLLAALSASASYIVVPAILRYAVPEARPGIYFTMALGLTFPFNIIAGIPLYHAISELMWR